MVGANDAAIETAKLRRRPDLPQTLAIRERREGQGEQSGAQIMTNLDTDLARLAGEAQRAKRREHARAYRAAMTPEQRAANCATNKRWRERNHEKYLATKRRYQQENPEKAMASRKKWNAANPEKVREYYHSYRLKHAARISEYFKAHWQRMKWLTADNREVMARDVYEIVVAAVPRTMPTFARDDVISEIMLSILEGKLLSSDVAAKAKNFVTAYYRAHPTKFAPISLDETTIDGGDPLIERISKGMWT